MTRAAVCFLALLWAAPAVAQNRCTEPPTLEFRPTTIYTVLTEVAAVIPGTSTPQWDQLEIGFFLDEVDPRVVLPVTTLTLAKAQLTLVPGTTNCYTASLPSVPTAARYGATRQRRTTVDPMAGDWGPLSNPFVFPAAPMAPGAVRFRP